MILLRILSLTALIVVAGVIAADSAHGPAGADLPTTSTSTSTTSTSTSTTSTTSTTVPPPPPTTPARTEPGEDRWDRLAQCESGQRWDANTGNGYGGALQFAHGPGWSTWRAFGGTEFAADPWDATREQQIIVAERVLARSGWAAWPGCARRFGWL